MRACLVLPTPLTPSQHLQKPFQPLYPSSLWCLSSWLLAPPSCPWGPLNCLQGPCRPVQFSQPLWPLPSLLSACLLAPFSLSAPFQPFWCPSSWLLDPLSYPCGPPNCLQGPPSYLWSPTSYLRDPTSLGALPTVILWPLLRCSLDLMVWFYDNDDGCCPPLH